MSSVAYHLVDRSLKPLGVRGEDSHRHETHVRHRRIGNQLLHALLRQRDQRGVNDCDHRKGENERGEIERGVRKHRQRKPDEAVAAHFQKNRGQHYRSRGRRLDMRVRQPGVNRPHRHLDRERGEEAEPQPGLHVCREVRFEQHGDVGRARGPVHRHDGEQHQHRAGEGVEEELERGVHPVPVTPNADDDEHRDEAALEEQVE